MADSEHTKAIRTLEGRIESIQDSMSQPPESEEAKGKVKALLAECQAQRKQMEAICINVFDGSEDGREKGEATFVRITGLLDSMDRVSEIYQSWSAQPLSGAAHGIGSGADDPNVVASDAQPDIAVTPSSLSRRSTVSDPARRDKKKKEKRQGKPRSSDALEDFFPGSADTGAFGAAPPASGAGLDTGGGTGPAAGAFGSGAPAWPGAGGDVGAGSAVGANAWGGPGLADAGGWPASSPPPPPPPPPDQAGAAGAMAPAPGADGGGGFDAGAWGSQRQDSGGALGGFDAGFGASFPDSAAQTSIGDGGCGSGFGVFGEPRGSPQASHDAGAWRGQHQVSNGHQHASLHMQLRFDRPNEATEILKDEDGFKQKLQRCIAQAVNVPPHRIQNIIVYEGT